LVLRRDVNEPNVPAVKVIDASGKTVAMYPVRDFSGASYIDIWDAKGTPNGDVIIAAILGYGSRGTKPIPVKSVLLTYDSTGTLRKVWDVNPYHHHLVAGDSAGNVFAFGDADDSSQSYALLVKYSPQGDVMKKFLPADLFPTKDASVRSSRSQNGESRMFVKNDKLFLYIATTQEMFIFFQDGVLLAKTQLVGVYDRISMQYGGAYIRTFEFGVDSSQNIIVELRVYPKEKAKEQSLILAKVAPDGSLLGLSARSAQSSPRQFLGLSNNDSPIYLEDDPVSQTMMIDFTKRYNLP